MSSRTVCVTGGAGFIGANLADRLLTDGTPVVDQIGTGQIYTDANGNYVLDLRPRRSTALLNRMVIVVNRDAVEPPPAPIDLDSSMVISTPQRSITG